jgi:hypothetical protein
MIFLTLCVILLSHNFCEKQLCDFDSTNCNGKHDINDQISYTCEWVNTYYYACLPLNDKNINCSLPSNESECDVGSCWGVNVSGLCVEVNEITLNLDDTITKIITENNESYSLLLYLKENTTNEEGGVAVVERSVSIYGYEVDNVPLVVIIPSNSLNFFDVGIGGVLKISYFTIMVENSSVERLNVSFIIINGDCSVVELKYCLVTIKYLILLFLFFRLVF